jgi:hypothetical protein
MVNIPNDKGEDWRIDKFVEYQHKVPPIYQATFAQYANNVNLSERDAVIASWFMAITYSEITTIWLMETFPLYELDRYDSWFLENEPTMIFGSAKKYNRYCGRFVSLMRDFHKHYIEGTTPEAKFYSLIGEGTEKQKYDNVHKYNGKIREFARFSGDLFNECAMSFQNSGHLKGEMSSPNSLNWYKGANETSGMFNLLYEDKLADDYDKTGVASKEMREWFPLFDQKLIYIRDKIQDRYPKSKVEIPLFTPKICSFRNLFKSSRYGGYHHDRQLEHIKQYQFWHPKLDDLWESIYTIRKQAFDPVLLGEINGWDGIRRERKKLWLNQGMTGVEAESITKARNLTDFF